jgi:predicted nucleic acid-binding protein
MYRIDLFLDTGYVIALLNPKDQPHEKAKALYSDVRRAVKVWTTEAVLIEIGNSLSANHRQEAALFISQCYNTRNISVVNISTDLLQRAIALYSFRKDKTWGLTDCISFIIMEEYNITAALTPDKHFEQAGFRALLRE